MRKWLGILILAGIMPIAGLGRMQEPPPAPPYAFAYSVINHEVRVAKFRPDADQWVEDKLQARVMLGVAQDGLILPRWSADGSTLYVTAFEPGVENIAVALFAYEAATGEFREIGEVIDPDEVFGSEYVQINAISPDEQVAWVTLLVAAQSRLIDLETGSTIATSSCIARVLTWLAEEVVTACTGVYFAEPQIMVLDLQSGEIVRQLAAPPQTDPYTAAYVTGGRLLDNDTYLVGSFGSAQETVIGLLDWEGSGGQYIAQGSHLSVSPDQHYAAFFSEGHIFRLDVESRELQDLGEAVVSSQPMWEEENALKYWVAQPVEGGLIRIIYTRQFPESKEERIVYEGLPPRRWITAPYGPYMAAEFSPDPAQSYVEIHDPYGLLWVSDAIFSGSFVQLPFEQDIAWSADGDWLHLRYSEAVGQRPRTLSLNVTTTREAILAPEQAALVVGESPDGLWWLYESHSETLDTPLNRLIVMQRDTKVMQVITEGVELYTNFIYPSWQYYVVSPMIQPDSELIEAG
jgi:hypothetical protein